MPILTGIEANNLFLTIILVLDKIAQNEPITNAWCDSELLMFRSCSFIVHFLIPSLQFYVRWKAH